MTTKCHIGMIIITIAFLFACSGCMTTEKMNAAMATWNGHGVPELLAKLGAPSQVLDGENGGKIYCFVFNDQYTTPGSSYTTYNSFTRSSYTTTIPGQTITGSRSRIFWVDTSGIIYKSTWTGL